MTIKSFESHEDRIAFRRKLVTVSSSCTSTFDNVSFGIYFKGSIFPLEPEYSLTTQAMLLKMLLFLEKNNDRIMSRIWIYFDDGLVKPLLKQGHETIYIISHPCHNSCIKISIGINKLVAYKQN